MMETSPVGSPPRTHTPPLPLPRRLHAHEALLVGAAFALILHLPGLLFLAGMPLAIGLLAVCAVIDLRARERAWGTIFLTSFAPPRIVLALSVAALCVLVPWIREDLGAPWRIAVTLLLPLGFHALSRWDERHSLDLFARRREATAPAPADRDARR